MKQFLKDNLAIVAAIALPLILVLVFAVSRAVTDRIVADPQYDFLIATSVYGGSNETFYFDVVQERLKISYAFPVQVNGVYQNGNISRLWRVHVPQMTVEAISLVPPPSADTRDGARISVEIPGVTDLHVLPTQPSPDGYSFERQYDYYDTGLLRDVFGVGGRRGPVSAIVKDGRAIPIENLDAVAYSPSTTRFIGWIAKEP